jgi:NADH-quinone oxidoreductase subunit L
MGHLLEHHPGLLFVAATLLPLASFLLLLLAGGLRAAVRPYRDESPLCDGLYRALGGETPPKLGAYIAAAAIGLACVCSVTGFVLHAVDHAHRHHLEVERESLEAKEQKTKGERERLEVLEQEIPALDAKWQGRSPWARVGWSPSDLQRAGSTLELGYRIDTLAAIMFVMVTFVATLIHIFSIGYMSDELAPVAEDHQVHTEEGHLHRRGRFGRFFMYLSLFCFSMLNLVLADNLFQVFVSWELVGICSYLLIGFYYERQSASNAANKAFITNRVGDAGFIIGLLVIWTYIGTFNFEDIFHRVRAPVQDAHGHRVDNASEIVRGELEPGAVLEGKPTLQIAAGGGQVLLMPIKTGHVHHNDYIAGQEIGVSEPPRNDEHGWMPYWLLVVAGLGIFTGCVGKSAQFPLQVWLPDAMEGPTPVSALIHAATMVAAGVYLVGRVYPLFTPEARLVIAYTGGITLFVAATVAIVMTDIKKVLAYSTVSQLGYMMLALGVGGWAAGLFHLLTHAFFKALLFLGSGSVIHGCHHEQEMPRMGGLLKKMPVTAITMLVGCLAIAGTPFLSGWYSKDAILANAFGFVYLSPQHFLLFLLPLVTAGITTFYMFRMWFMTFTGAPRDHHVHEHAHESPWTMTMPLVVLAVCTVVVGWGWPIWDAEGSFLEAHLHHAQHPAVYAEFGRTEEYLPTIEERKEHYWAQQYHSAAGFLALGAAGLGFVFAAIIYLARRLDATEAAAQFPGVFAFLKHKWYFDEAYSALLVRPALVVAHWCRAFDTYVIDGFINWLARFSLWVSKWDGKFDNGVVDGLVNVVGNVVYATGARLRNVQTGYIRSYVLFLVLAAIAIYALLAYFVSQAPAGP